MTAHQKLLERLIRHQIQVQRFSGSQIKKAMPILRQLAKDLQARIQAGTATEFQMGRMYALQRDLAALAAEASDNIQQALDLEDFAVQEGQFTQQLLGASVSAQLSGGLNAEALRGLTTRRQLQLISGDTVKRMTIPQLWDEFSEAVGRNALRTVQAGVLEGHTTQQMARDVSQMVATRTRRQAEAVIRTSVNGIGGAARDMVYQDNRDILEGERFLAVLDSRTTLTCSGNDQKIFPLGQGPMPPLHYGCRSLRVPEVKPEYRIAAKGERASYEGPVSNQLTYGGFLRNQSKEFQNDVLGPRRAELFRSGKVKIEQFTDDMGRVLTLDELAARTGITLD